MRSVTCKGPMQSRTGAKAKRLSWNSFLRMPVISSFAIHHVSHERKQELYSEIFKLPQPDGVFCNLERVSSPTRELHRRFLGAMDLTFENEDPSNELLDVETQLRWLQELGFADVDCH
jgi:tRNA (cmo5U34)-methyltransferase